MRKFYAIFFSLLFALSVNAQQQVSGDLIRSNNSSKYTSKNLFDNNPATRYEASVASGAWIGLDLGSQHVITQIEFAGGVRNMHTGIFEGANTRDFADAVPLHMIKSATSEKVIYTVNIAVSRGFRYVRYMGANNSYCAINELKFFGHLSAGNDSKLYQITNLPTVVINTTTKQDITTKEEYQTGNVTIVDKGGKLAHAETLRIKGRGNASWGVPKKGFRIKLDEKRQLLDAPATAKDWTLIACYKDRAVLRSALSFEIARKVGFHFTPYQRLVDLIVNGDYRGTYNLCDQIEVDKNRVNIEKQKETDTSGDAITGGYLIEIDTYAYAEDSYFRSEKHKIPVTIKYPKDDEINEAQSAYIANHFNKLEAALFSDKYKDAKEGYRKYLDTESFANYLLFEELVGNADAYNSTYLIKKRGDDLLYTGPVWDFDLSFENDDRSYPNGSLGDFLALTKGSSAGSLNFKGGMRNFLDRLHSDPAYVADLERIWKDIRLNKGITADYLNTRIKELKDEYKESADLNFVRWPIMFDWNLKPNVAVFGSYEGEVNHVLTYAVDRLKWLDKKLKFKAPQGDDNTYFAPVAVEGFNSDVIAEGRTLVGSLFKKYVSQPLDLNGYALFTQGVQSNGAMPYDGILRSEKSNSFYKLNGSTSYNALHVTYHKDRTLRFVNPVQTEAIMILGASLSGTSLMNATIIYTDGSKERNLLMMNDFYTHPHQPAITSLKVRQTVIAGKVMNFKMHEYKLMANPAKTIASVTFNNDYWGRGFIFAIASQVEKEETVAYTKSEITDGEIVAQNSSKVYPSPVVSGQDLTVECSNPIKTVLMTSLSSGLPIIQTGADSNSTQLSTGGLHPGVYMLQIIDIYDQKTTQKVVIK